MFRYLRFFKKEIVLNLIFNLLHVFFNLFSYALIIPFAELLFGLSPVAAECPQLDFSQRGLTDWALWHLYQYKESLGL